MNIMTFYKAQIKNNVKNNIICIKETEENMNSLTIILLAIIAVLVIIIIILAVKYHNIKKLYDFVISSHVLDNGLVDGINEFADALMDLVDDDY